VYRALPDVAAALAAADRAAALQREIWSAATTAADGIQPATMLLLPALNEVFDLATTRTMAAKAHPPVVIFGLLIAFAMLSAVLSGYATAASSQRQWLHSLVFALVLASAVYVIIDIEFPRLGLIRVDAFDQALVDVRASME